MTRATKYRAIYWCLVLAVSIVVFAIGMAWGDRTNILPVLAPVVLAIGMALPEPLLLFLWRDLRAGMRLWKQKDHAGSKLRSERFVAKVRKAQWLKHVGWLAKGSYSGDPEALALNYLGSAEIRLGAYEAAQGHFEEAIALEPEDPLPYRNIGIARLLAGNPDEAISWLEKAEALGLRDASSDRLMKAAQSRFAFLTSSYIADHTPSGQPDLPSATGDFRVELQNDDVTPMAFVVELLEQVFNHSEEQAIHTMLAVHDQGSAVCGRYEEADAQARMDSAIARARAAGFPLSLRVAIDTPA